MEEAIKKKHATTGEAIRIGAEMGVWRTVLTHFSQRYPKVRFINQEFNLMVQVPIIDEQFTSKCMIAFDLMRINIKEFRDLPAYLSSVGNIFAEEVKELKE